MRWTAVYHDSETIKKTDKKKQQHFYNMATFTWKVKHVNIIVIDGTVF